MFTADWKRVNDILAEALSVPPDERDPFLASACGGDVSLRREVEALLAAEPDKCADLSQPAIDLVHDHPELTPGSSVGPYRILDEIGRGGMGTIYRAERADGSFERQVAIKVLKLGMDSREVLRRFHAERHIQAQLEHPWIAELYEGGTTDDHRPYFVMELVDGEPIDRYCDHHELGVSQRLGLFRKVCDAVQYAHGHLIVHRDLKPGNILVNALGEPKLLDFGIAKVLDPDSQLAQTDTATGLQRMTPEYASPEQILGKSATTTSDVYSLGVILYELLTGRRPHRLGDRSNEEGIGHLICTREPEKPSTVVGHRASVQKPKRPGTAGGGIGKGRSESRKLQRRLSGDLDSIVLKALRKEPEHRYSSVDQLSEDIRRHLESRPVRARRGTVTYRIGKLLRRRGREIAATSAAALLLVLFAADRTIQQRKVAKERDRAENVTRFLIDLFEENDPFTRRGENITAREVFRRGAEKIAVDDSLDPATRAALMQTLGVIQTKLGAYPEAGELLAEALAVRRSLSPRRNRGEVVESLASLALLRYQTGDLAEAEDLYRQALEHRARIDGTRSAPYAQLLNELGLVLMSRGELEAAEAKHRQALAVQRELLPAKDPDLAITINDLALSLLIQGRFEESEALFREALRMEIDLFGPDHPRLEAVYSNLASVLMQSGQPEEAEAYFRRALAIAAATYGDGHPSVARISNNLAAILRDRGDLQAAEELYRQALSIAESAFGNDHPNVARTMNGLAICLRLQGQTTEARDLLEHSLRIESAALGDEHSSIGRTLTHLASVLRQEGDAKGAVEVATRALDNLRAALPPGHFQIALTESVLGACLADLGRLDEAEAILGASLQRLEETMGIDASETREARQLLGSIRRARESKRSERVFLWPDPAAEGARPEL